MCVAEGVEYAGVEGVSAKERPNATGRRKFAIRNRQSFRQGLGSRTSARTLGALENTVDLEFRPWSSAFVSHLPGQPANR